MKVLFIFVALAIHFAFSTKFLNASGFNESYSLRGGLSTVNEAGIIFYNMEIFKDIKGYEGVYQVSNYGRVKSLPRNTTSGRILKSGKTIHGYLRTWLCKNGKKKQKPMHRIIAIAFIPNLHNKPCINHKNGIKTDNRIKNLEWVTYKENAIHSFKIGLSKPTLSINAHFTKINYIIAREIRELYVTGDYSQTQLGLIYNLHQSTIFSLINYKTWKQKKVK